MSEPVCAHDFIEPVVVRTEATESFLWFFSRHTLSREVAIAFCRHCGKQTMAGWTKTDD